MACTSAGFPAWPRPPADLPPSRPISPTPVTTPERRPSVEDLLAPPIVVSATLPQASISPMSSGGSGGGARQQPKVTRRAPPPPPELRPPRVYPLRKGLSVSGRAAVPTSPALLVLHNQRAEAHLRDALARCIAAFGKTDAMTLKVANVLARVLEQEGRGSEAFQLLQPVPPTNQVTGNSPRRKASPTPQFGGGTKSIESRRMVRVEAVRPDSAPIFEGKETVPSVPWRPASPSMVRWRSGPQLKSNGIEDESPAGKVKLLLSVPQQPQTTIHPPPPKPVTAPNDATVSEDLQPPLRVSEQPRHAAMLQRASQARRNVARQDGNAFFHAAGGRYVRGGGRRSILTAGFVGGGFVGVSGVPVQQG